MKIDVQKLENSKMQLEVTVDEARVAAALNGAYKKVVTKVNMPGFRRGKVPRQILEARYGVEVLYEDAIDILLPEVYKSALEEAKVEPLDQPDVDVIHFARGEEAKFKFVVELMPEVNVGEYKGIEVKKPEIVVTDEQVEQELAKLRERHARLIDASEGKVQTGDTVVIDYSGSVDGVLFSGGSAERQNLVIGSGSFIAGFEEQLVGMVRDEERNIEVTFPSDYRATELAGKAAVFRIKLHEIKRKELPELDDELAKEVSEQETLEGLRHELRERLTKTAESNQKTRIENEVVAKVVENVSVEIPKVLLEREVDSMVEDMGHNLSRSGLKLEQYLQYINKTMENLRSEFLGSAEKRVKTGLVIDKIGQIENISVDEAEFSSHLEEMGKPYGQTGEQVYEMLAKRGQLEAVRASLITGKTIDYLVKEANIQ